LSDVEVISQEQKGQKLNLIVRKPAEETNSQFVSRLAGQVEILSFAERMPSMNEVFLRVVGNDEIR
jgi:ABC-type uncharacterized transport system ATPase subunit